jgi:hypothetical protein
VDTDQDRLALQRDLDRLSDWAVKWQLRFNVEKCKTMHLGGVRNNKYGYAMKSLTGYIPLQETEIEKDLGVWVSNSMKPAGHVMHAVDTANKILGLIRRTFTYLDCKMVKQLYTSLVRPHLEYANIVWHPFLRKDVEHLEAVQHRATRLAPELKKLSYEQRLQRMELPTLEYRRLRGDALEVYKYFHGAYKVDCADILPPYRNTGFGTRGHRIRIQKRDCNGQIRANFFGFRTVNMWNSLPEHIVTSPTVNCFKGRFDRYCCGIQYSERAADCFRDIARNCSMDHQLSCYEWSTGILPTLD